MVCKFFIFIKHNRCARKFFTKIISDQVQYDMVNSYSKLMKLVK